MLKWCDHRSSPLNALAMCCRGASRKTRPCHRRPTSACPGHPVLPAPRRPRNPRGEPLFTSVHPSHLMLTRQDSDRMASEARSRYMEEPRDTGGDCLLIVCSLAACRGGAQHLPCLVLRLNDLRRVACAGCCPPHWRQACLTCSPSAVARRAKFGRSASGNCATISTALEA